jgi:hypothetical protein
MNTCKAIVQQGPRKGQQCLKDKTNNEYCVYHQRNHEYDTLISKNINVCGMFYRGCNNELSDDDIQNNIKNCHSCRKHKSEKHYPCQHKGCTAYIVNEVDKYCKKHIRQLLKDNEKEENIKYCDIDRGCFNKIISGNKCEACKNKDKKESENEINKLRKKYGMSDNQIVENILQSTQEEKTISVSELWRCIQKGAYSRSLLFTITESDFEKTVIQPCYYCGFVSKSRLNGIDRINNNKGYTVENSITCCTMCNIIKNKQHPNEFLDKVNIIVNKQLNNKDIDISYINKWKGYLSKNIRNSYNSYKHKCKDNNLEFLLSENEYNTIINGKCYICGISNMENHNNGIDRFDTTIRAYIVGNSKTCCGHCNVMKGALLYDNFVTKCIQIHNHNCDRKMFENIPHYEILHYRNEYYTADDIFTFMTNGTYNNYLEWCIEKKKSSEFISTMNIIMNFDTLNQLNKSNIIERIQNELKLERNRKSINEKSDDKKYIQSPTLYAYLTQGKTEYFKELYNSKYTITDLFEIQLN